MLKQLRGKFILINMLLVSLVLLTALTVQYISFRQQTIAETDSALQRAVQWGESGPDRWQIGQDRPLLPERDDSKVLIPTFCVILSRNGTVTAILDNNVEVSDEALAAALTAALTGEADRGELTGLGLRYLRTYSGGSLRIAFADTAWERAALHRQLLTLLLMLAAALAGFFVISLFLSRWAMRPTERSWKQQQQFIADASHELKTPLTVLLADADILLAHPDDTIESQRKWVEYIQDEALRMKGLVEDMLFLARSDRAAEKDRKQLPVPLSDLCWNCILSFEPVAFEQGAELSGDVADGVTVTGDEAQLRRLVAILLDNACKYCGPKGTVSLSLARNGDKAVLSVRNTGTPIPAEALPHLFERFYRADAARDRQTGGYGLGLAIAASIVQQHRGKISVDSSDEQGTVFTVTLPARSAAGA